MLPSSRAQRSNEVPGSSRRANAAIRRAAAVDVGHRHHLDRGVHVPARDRDQPGGDPSAAEVDRVGVGAGPLPQGLERVWNVLGLGRLVQPLEDQRVQGCPAGDDRPRIEWMAGDRPELDPRLIGGEGQVDHHRDVRIVCERAGARAGERSLLLGYGQSQHVARRAAGLRDQPGRLGGDVTADAVVQRARDDPLVTELDRFGVDHCHVPDADQPAGLVGVLGPDVDVKLLELGHLLAVLVLEEVDRLAADHAGHVAVARAQPHPLADQHAGVPPADLAEAQIPVVVDVRDVQADLVDVADDGHGEPSGGAGDPRVRGADAIAAHVLGEGRAVLPPHLCRHGLVPRGTGRAQEPHEQFRRTHAPKAIH